MRIGWELGGLGCRKRDVRALADCFGGGRIRACDGCRLLMIIKGFLHFLHLMPTFFPTLGIPLTPNLYLGTQKLLREMKCAGFGVLDCF